jgi:hypothetical protein
VEFRHEDVTVVGRKRPEYVRACPVQCSLLVRCPPAKRSRYLVRAQEPVVDSLQCDQIPLPDGCGQCATAKRNCPGYRAPGELVFRDQSTSVARKVKAREAKAKQRRKQDSVPASIPGENSAVGPQQSPETVKWQQRRQQQLQQPSLGITLMPTIEERATGLFVTNYVLCARGPSRGHRKRIPRSFPFVYPSSLIVVGRYDFLEIDFAIPLG